LRSLKTNRFLASLRAASFRDWNEEAYCRALENTDRLFLHELAIRRRGPRFGDKALAKTWLLNVSTDIYQFRFAIKDEKARAKFNILSKAILERLLQHYRNIIKRVNVIYPKPSFIREKEKRFPHRYAAPPKPAVSDQQQAPQVPNNNTEPAAPPKAISEPADFSHEQEEAEPHSSSDSS
jgi:hypothetical protein